MSDKILRMEISQGTKSPNAICKRFASPRSPLTASEFDLTKKTLSNRRLPQAEIVTLHRDGEVDEENSPLLARSQRELLSYRRHYHKIT
jgi:hypothetical protein